jgi:hypothetical protein
MPSPALRRTRTRKPGLVERKLQNAPAGGPPIRQPGPGRNAEHSFFRHPSFAQAFAEPLGEGQPLGMVR